MNSQTINRLVRAAQTLDQMGEHAEADSVAEALTSMAPPRTAQQAGPQRVNQPPYPAETDVLGNRGSDFFNSAGAWTNQHLLQNQANNYDMLWRRVVGLREDASENASVNADLRQALTGQLDAIAATLGPYTREARQASATSTVRPRLASVRDLSGLERMVESLRGLAQQTLGDVNPPLLAQITPRLDACASYLSQFGQGVASGYSANYQAQQYAGGQTSSPSGGASVPPAEGLTQQPPTGGDWYSQNGTTSQMFLARCKAYSDASGGISALRQHLEQNSIPPQVVSEALRSVGT